MLVPFGTPVVDKHGKSVGTVSRVVLDSQAREVVSLVVHHGVLNRREVEVPISKVTGFGDEVRLSLAAAEFNELAPFHAPSFRVMPDHWDMPVGFDQRSFFLVGGSAWAEATLPFAPTSPEVSGTPRYVRDPDAAQEPPEPDIAAGTHVYSAVYDMGGVREWFGPIPVEANEPVFHHRWEARVFASLLMTNGMLGISEEAFRWAGERLPRAQYLAGYYQRWLATLEQMVIDHGVLAPGELDAHLAGEQPTVSGHAGPGLLRRALTRKFVRTLVGPPPQWLMRLYPRLQDIHLPKLAKPRFAIGDRVGVSAAPTAPTVIHTRRPRYTWGKRGTVVGYHFATVLPERSASGERGPDEHFYTVEFDGSELWGDDAEPGTAVRIDLFESYLEATS